MARGRMLDKSFVKSQKLNQLTRDQRLAYAMILPFLDREGRTVAEPIVLKALVFRWSDFTIDEIADAVAAMARVELVSLYADRDNSAIIQFVRFEEFNSPNSKEAKSDLPGPDDPNAQEVRDERIAPLLTPAPASPVHGTGNARAMQVENGTERNVERQRRTEAHDSSEARFQRMAETGSSEHHETSRTRATIRRLAGTKFASEHEDDLLAWSRWSDQQLRDLWEASDPKRWPGEERKRRVWIYADLLNEDRHPERVGGDSAIDDLLRRYMHAEGVIDGEPFTVIAAGPDGKTLVTDSAGYLTPQQVEEGMRCART